MPYFSDQALADMRAQFASVPEKLSSLQMSYVQHNFREARAKEFAHHGYVRRLQTLARCIQNLFALIPPEQEALVDRGVRQDAEINIQTSVFNVFAAADNLAWIWVVEKGVRRHDGSELPDTWIGLRRKNRAVRDALPATLQNYLAGVDDWFDMVDNYRHALAHRIPLYIPPYVVTTENEATHQSLESAKDAARFSGDLLEHDRLQDQQRQMEFFRPWMQHSFGEGVRPLVFHPQLLANFNTIEELGRKVLEELG
jgi:hypothetical protein